MAGGDGLEPPERPDSIHHQPDRVPRRRNLVLLITTNALLLIEQNMKRTERTQRNQFKSHQVCLTKRELLKHFVCFINGVEIQKKDDAFIILPDVPLINLPGEIKPRRSGNLTRHDCLALLGRE